MITAVKLFCIWDTSLPPVRPPFLHCAVLPPGKSITTNFQKFIILIDSILTFKNYNFLNFLHGGQTNSYLSRQKKNKFRNLFSQLNPKILPFTCRIADKRGFNDYKRHEKSKKENNLFFFRLEFEEICD